MKKISFFIFIAFCFSMTQAGAADISCSSRHYKSDSVCKPCSEITENCSSCSSAGKCLSCEYGYTLSGGKCVDRPQEVCSKGYHENFNFQECVKCSPAFTSAADCKSKTANATACVYNSTNGCYKAVCPSGYAEGGTTTSYSNSSEKHGNPAAVNAGSKTAPTALQKDTLPATDAKADIITVSAAAAANAKLARQTQHVTVLMLPANPAIT